MASGVDGFHGKSHLQMDDLGVPLFQETTIYLLRYSLGKCFIKFYKWMRKSGAVYEREASVSIVIRCDVSET